MRGVPPEMLEAMRKQYAANEAAHELAEQKRLQRDGEIGFKLVPSPDDPPQGSEEFQKELSEFYSNLDADGVPYSPRIMTFDSADGGGFPLGEFSILVKYVVPSIAASVITWIKVKHGRVTKIIVDGETITVTANRPEDAEHAFEQIARLKHELSQKESVNE